MVLPSGVRLLAACVTVFGLGLGVSFRLRPFGFLRFSAPFPYNCNVSFCPVLRPAGCTRKMVIDFATLEGLSGFMLHKMHFSCCLVLRLAGCTQDWWSLNCCNISALAGKAVTAPVDEYAACLA